MSNDQRRYAPAAARNREPIRDVLRRHLPQRGRVLEIASGTGEHVTFLAQSSDPGLVFQPSDADASARESIDAWTKALALSNVLPAVALDVTSPDWPTSEVDAVLCINMIHIAPWSAAESLVRGASHILKPNGMLYLYGPFRRGGRHTGPGNEAFDRELRNRDPAWGVRDLEAVVALAGANGFGTPSVETMPADNLSLVFRRVPPATGRDG
jgi:SAM-dependent methyltransferase